MNIIKAELKREKVIWEGKLKKERESWACVPRKEYCEYCKGYIAGIKAAVEIIENRENKINKALPTEITLGICPVCGEKTLHPSGRFCFRRGCYTRKGKDD